MKQLIGLMALLLAAACSPETGQSPQTRLAASGASPEPVAAAPSGPVCRVAANGGPILADRGIGGTGVSSDPSRLTDRGIGGTGIGTQIPISVVRGFSDPTRGSAPIAENRIGDVGVVGVITGFSSVCIDGLEVALDGAVPVVIDGRSVPASFLRAGQVAVIEVRSEAMTLRALNVAVQHEVIGPIERRDGGDGLTVAGQPVTVAPAAWGRDRLAVGDWVAVSGLRAPDGSILATRIDPAAKGTISVRGPVVVMAGRPRIGGLGLLPQPGRPVAAGSFVVASGAYSGRVLQASKVESDTLAHDPVGYFGPSVHRIIMRSMILEDAGRVLLHGAVPVPLAAGVVASGQGVVNAVLVLDRAPDGSYSASKVDATGLRLEGSAPVGEPVRQQAPAAAIVRP